MVDYKLIGQRLQAVRKSKKITQEIVAEQANITSVYLSKIENGKVKPTIETYAAICSFLDCDLGSLLSETRSDSPNYQGERVVELFRACAPEIKPIALELLKKLSEIKTEQE